MYLTPCLGKDSGDATVVSTPARTGTDFCDGTILSEPDDVDGIGGGTGGIGPDGGLETRLDCSRPVCPNGPNEILTAGGPCTRLASLQTLTEGGGKDGCLGTRLRSPADETMFSEKMVVSETNST